MCSASQDPGATGRPAESGDRQRAAGRVLIVGLDGATMNVLGPLMAEGLMPRLKEAVDHGASGILRSTVPPLTPAAWTAFLTGRKPGSHGVIDFEYYDVHTGQLRFHSTYTNARVPNLWRILSDRGLKVGSINVPMTYPPYPVNGFLVSGFETPGPESDFVYPLDLKHEILQRWPDPTLGTKWKRGRFGGMATFHENLDYISQSFHQGADMTMWLGEKYGWDALMVVLKLVDNLQHKTWKYLDPRWPQRDRERREMVRRCFAELDRAVGTLLDYAEKNDAAVMMVSDHGHGSLEGKVYPNELLRRWGYLVLQRKPPWKGRKKHVSLVRGEPGGIDQHVPADLSRTRACVMHAGNAAFVYINLEGRQPTGIVKPAEYEALRDELKDRFLSDDCRVRNLWGESIRLFTEVHKPEELYNRSREDEPWMPDLILIQHETLAAVRARRGRQVVRWLPYRRMEGTHRPEGIIICTGPGITHKTDVDASIIDCAPTILAMMGVPVRANMEGRVLEEILEHPATVETEPTAEELEPASVAQQAEPPKGEAYSEEELRQVTDRLADLGYLE